MFFTSKYIYEIPPPPLPRKHSVLDPKHNAPGFDKRCGYCKDVMKWSKEENRIAEKYREVALSFIESKSLS